MKDLLTLAGAMGVGYFLLSAIDRTSPRTSPRAAASRPPDAASAPTTGAPSSYPALPEHPGHARFGLN